MTPLLRSPGYCASPWRSSASPHSPGPTNRSAHSNRSAASYQYRLPAAQAKRTRVLTASTSAVPGSDRRACARRPPARCTVRRQPRPAARSARTACVWLPRRFARHGAATSADRRRAQRTHAFVQPPAQAAPGAWPPRAERARPPPSSRWRRASPISVTCTSHVLPIGRSADHWSPRLLDDHALPPLARVRQRAAILLGILLKEPPPGSDAWAARRRPWTFHQYPSW